MCFYCFVLFAVLEMRPRDNKMLDTAFSIFFCGSSAVCKYNDSRRVFGKKKNKHFRPFRLVLG